ncbi:nitroreductase family protein [Microbacterium sp. R86528]|uniref:nitroreductase family protein n=1 Tax=Microbacterium sp. R86528 TaxID=3093864 RepID=UPI0037CC0C13
MRALPKHEAHTASFRDVASRRVSIREFSDAPVSYDDVREAIGIASLAPSACNRQSARVHLVTDPQIIDSILRIQAGLGGYPRPPMLILITGDASSYVEATERNQPYVDGALFAMSLIYALEDEGLGTCALTAMLWRKHEKAVRDLLLVPPSECFVTFIAVGRVSQGATVPLSKRASVEAITTVHASRDERAQQGQSRETS